ncbi:septal ring lytic transglycosylase RlpA family protein [Natronogracilivirgula saccharolytica]|uniref:Probable endolytic peptidoglycan transglycosylase RlpA n=1 Tax=Natronogracilivirga saccharolytica TaxID=2812953 RepID=A0A8J7UVW9_9BACT|nr:septal ring lytic transglycosylase RlpA family protein [Natronogracilivirga saccharolytica]MBP3193021.1 septal ring lytic transglycosylase RlpA family protein [Natronogracilivirga saccharolytica]
MINKLGYSVVFAVVLLTAWMVSSCAFPEADREEVPEVLQEGVASWYGPGFHGRRTSNGEIYNENDTTAAHRTLPFDTVVRVVNTENEKSVKVRINDRGPYVGDRIIDLSRAAAQEIDMLDSGTARVRLELVEAGGDIPDDLEQELFTIQLAEYSGPMYAERFAEDVGGEARVEYVDMFQRGRYMVYHGTYYSIQSAREDLALLREQGYDGLVKQIN